MGARHGLAEAASFLRAAGKRGNPYVAVSEKIVLDEGALIESTSAGAGKPGVAATALSG